MKSKRILTIIITNVVLLFCSIHIYQQSLRIPYNSDEISWFFHIQFFQELFIQHRSTSTLWNSYESFDHPQLGKYIYGSYLYSQNKEIFLLRDALEHRWGRWDFYFNPALQNIGQSEFAPHIQLMRRVTVLFSVLAVLLFFGLTVIFLHDFLLALTVPVILSFHPLFLNTMLRTTSDAFMVCFIAAAFFIMATEKYKQHTNISLFIGMLLGCAISSKLTGLLGVCIWGLYETFLCIRNEWPVRVGIKRVGLGLIGIFFVWFCINPALYSHPIENSMQYLQFRMHQSSLLQGYFSNIALPTWYSKFYATYCTLFHPSCARYFGAVSSFFFGESISIFSWFK